MISEGRRTYVGRILPNAESCLRLVRSLCVEYNEAWCEAHLPLNMQILKAHKTGMRRRAAWGCPDSTQGITAIPAAAREISCASDGGTEGRLSPDPMIDLPNLTHPTVRLRLRAGAPASAASPVHGHEFKAW